MASYSAVNEVNAFASQWSDPSSQAFDNSDNHGRTIFKYNATSNAKFNAYLLDAKDISKGELVFVVGNTVNREITCIGSLNAVNAMLAAEYQRAKAQNQQLFTDLYANGEADSRNNFPGVDRSKYTQGSFWACTLYGIFEKIKFVGVMDNIDGRNSSNFAHVRNTSDMPGVHRRVRQRQVVISVSVAGKGIAKNIWGGKRDFGVGRRLYLIIRKESRNEPFQIKPFVLDSQTGVSPDVEFYTDQGGVLQRSGVIRVGKATSSPLHDYLDKSLVDSIVGHNKTKISSSVTQMNYSYADDVKIALANTPSQVLIF